MLLRPLRTTPVKLTALPGPPTAVPGGHFLAEREAVVRKWRK